MDSLEVPENRALSCRTRHDPSSTRVEAMIKTRGFDMAEPGEVRRRQLSKLDVVDVLDEASLGILASKVASIVIPDNWGDSVSGIRKEVLCYSVILFIEFIVCLFRTGLLLFSQDGRAIDSESYAR